MTIVEEVIKQIGIGLLSACVGLVLVIMSVLYNEYKLNTPKNPDKRKISDR